MLYLILLLCLLQELIILASHLHSRLPDKLPNWIPIQIWIYEMKFK